MKISFEDAGDVSHYLYYCSEVPGAWPEAYLYDLACLAPCHTRNWVMAPPEGPTCLACIALKVEKQLLGRSLEDIERSNPGHERVRR